MFDWADLLDLAEELVQRTGDEAAERSAISRASYACFCTARRSLDPDGLRIPKSGSGHAIVWTAFHTGPTRTHRRIANQGRRLRLWRSKSEYDDTYPDLSKEARTAVDVARRLLSDLASLQ